MDFKNQVVMVTGANGGIGSSLVEAFLKAGVKKVYACARNTSYLTGMFNDERVQAVELDITKDKNVQEVATKCADTTILVNNAGIAAGGLLNNKEQATTEIQVNYLGTHAMCSAFAPVLKANGGGCIVNIASMLSLINMPSIGSYSASKAALHSLTVGMRSVLAEQKTKVIGVYPGPVETRATEGLEMPMAKPDDVAKEVIEAISSGAEYVFPDEMSKESYKQFLADHKAVERQFGAF